MRSERPDPMRGSARSDVDAFIVMDVMEAARKAEAAGRRVIHMEVGQPGTPAPLGAREAAARAIRDETLGYTVALGLPELRERIAGLYRERHGVDLDPERVVVTAGSSGAFILAFCALFDPGDRIGVASPGYPSYRNTLKALDLEAVDIPAASERGFQPTPGDIAGLGLRGLLLASPANPTGSMLDRAELGALMQAAAGQGAAVISDEIYHGLEYGKPAVSALEISDACCVVNSFSKYFSMTGWRIGWMVAPRENVRAIERLAQNLFLCPSHVGQVAALAAMDCRGELDANVKVYEANRRLMMEGLPRAGLKSFAPPDGAFYVYADVSGFTQDSRAFAGEILDAAGVAVTPGVDFDPARGARTLRFSYAAASADIEEGIERLVRFMERRGGAAGGRL